MTNIFVNYFQGSRITDDWNAHIKRGSLGGVDYAVAVGTPIKAPTSGRIVNLANNGSGGHTVNLIHANGYKTQFMHLSRFVSEGAVNQGDIIGYTGGARGSVGAGSSTGPHCHIHMINTSNKRVNMLDYVGKSFGKATPVAPSVNNKFQFSNPTVAVLKAVQARLKALGHYAGTVDGIIGPMTRKAIQKQLKQAGYYSGVVDGIVGINTVKGFQKFAADKGGYTGGLDNIVGKNSWNGYLAGIKK